MPIQAKHFYWLLCETQPQLGVVHTTKMCLSLKIVADSSPIFVANANINDSRTTA